MPDLAPILQSAGVPPAITNVVLHVTSTLFALAMVLRFCRPAIVRSLTWLVDRFDDIAAHPSDNGATLLALVDSRAYRTLWWICEVFFRIHLPNRASLEARWSKIENAERGAGNADTHPNLDGTGLRSFAALLLLVPFLFTGCGSPKLTAFKSVSAVAHTVDTSMNAWGDWVRAGKATPDSEARVEAAYVKYQAAMAVVKTGVIAAEGQPADSPAYLAVPAALSAAAADLIALIDQFAPPEKR